jgi:hypothetical protein
MNSKRTNQSRERWTPVDTLASYQVSLGRIRNADGTIKAPTISRYGTLVVNLYAKGKTDVQAVHSVVARAFLGPRPKGHMVVHKDGDASNCRAANLSYAPLGQRQPRKVSERGRPLAGKLTGAQALEIRLRAQAGESTLHLAEEFDVSSSLVSNIKKGKKWKG